MAAALAAVLPWAAQAQGLVRGTVEGADRGAAAAGPVGAVVGGAVGAATGAVGGILGFGDRPAFHEYVETEHVRSYTYDEPVRVGAVLPGDYTYYDIPERFHVHGPYRYTVINHHPVIVEPGSRKIVEVFE